MLSVMEADLIAANVRSMWVELLVIESLMARAGQFDGDLSTAVRFEADQPDSTTSVRFDPLGVLRHSGRFRLSGDIEPVPSKVFGEVFCGHINGLGPIPCEADVNSTVMGMLRKLTFTKPERRAGALEGAST